MSVEQDKQLIESALQTISIEQDAITRLRDNLDTNFAQGIRLLLERRGRIITMGVGKSGHIARKIAATLSSTGSPSFFVHAAEAGHGDMGMVTAEDAVILLSYSGSSKEIVILMPLFKRLNIPIIGLVGDTQSPIARGADIVFDVGVDREACPLELAPTASTTTMLVLGDAIAMALSAQRGFTKDHFAFSHPSGKLGQRLLQQVADLMHTGDDIPQVDGGVFIAEALVELAGKRLGCTAITDSAQQLLGVFTDGDLRRAIHRKVDIQSTAIAEIMSRECLTTTKHTLAIDALRQIQTHQITVLMVVDDQKKLIGVIHLHDLIKAGLD